MKLKMKRRLRINAQGKELNKFINLIHQKRIDCRGQYCRGDVFHGDIFRRDLKKLRSIAQICGVEVKCAEYDSLFGRMYRYRRRLGLLAGVLLAFIGALYFSQVVVTIEIQGNSTVSDEVILSALAEMDIKAGTPISRLDLPYCENKLRLMIDDIAWAGIRHTGSRIVVQVTEVEQMPDMLRDRVPCNIVASRDAEISSVLVRSGQLTHIVGDFVPKGTILISGVAQSDTGRTYVHHAMGDIRGIYEDNVSFSAAFRSEEQVPTGRTDTQRTLHLFSLDIPLYFGKNSYKNSTSSVSESPLTVFGHELPIGIKQREISETTITEKEFTEEELTEKLMERVYLYENNFLGDADILSRTVTTERTDDTLTVSVTYKVESSITEQRDIFIK